MQREKVKNERKREREKNRKNLFIYVINFSVLFIFDSVIITAMTWYANRDFFCEFSLSVMIMIQMQTFSIKIYCGFSIKSAMQ